MSKGNRPISNELDLHGLTVDEALPEVDRFIYEAYMAHLPSISIVHGKGSGTLRGALWAWLPKHPLVRRFSRADQISGGSGATVVELVD